MFFIFSFIKLPLKLINKFINFLQNSVLLRPFFKIARLIFKTSLLLTIATLIYVYYYLKTIPLVNQNILLQTTRVKEGYHARVLSSGHSIPTCEYQNLLEFNKTTTQESSSKFCKLRHDESQEELVLEGESYHYTLVVDLPYSEHNIKVGGVVARVEFIDPNMNNYEAYGYGLLVKRRGLMGWIYYFIQLVSGYEGNMRIEVPIRENFNNKIFQVAVVDIMVESPALIVENFTLRVTTDLKGFRYYMHNWFFSCGIFSILWLMVAIRVAIGLILSILIRLKITTKKATNAFFERIKKTISKGLNRVKKPVVKFIGKYDPLGPLFERISNFFLSRNLTYFQF